jgi:hypothetical protein
MPTTSTEISRSKLQHPDLNHDGGAALHAKIATMYTELGDNANSRISDHTGITDLGFVVIDHNLGANLEELTVLIYSGTGATKQLILDSANLGWVIAEEAGNEETQIRVTAPGSGGPHTFTVVVIDAQLRPFDVVQLLTSIPGNASSGSLRRWIDANGRGLTKTSTGVIGTQQTLTPVHTAGPAVTCFPGFHYIIDTSGAPVTATLPATIADYDVIQFSDATKTFNSANLTIARNGNSVDGEAEDLVLNKAGDGALLVGDNTNSNWIKTGSGAGGGLTPVFIDSGTTPAFTAEVGNHYFVDATTAAVAVTLTQDEGQVRFSEGSATGSWGTNSVTITSGGGQTIEGDATLVGDVDNTWFQLTLNEGKTDWLTEDAFVPTFSDGTTGTGEGGINYVTNSDAETDVITGVTATNITVAAEVGTPLWGDTSFNCDSTGSTGTVDWAIDITDAAVTDTGLLLSVLGYFNRDNNGALADWTVGIYNVTDAAYATTETSLELNTTNIYRAAFSPVAGKTYVLRLNRTVSTASHVVIADKLTVSPDSNSAQIDPSPDFYIKVQGGNGHGSTNTTIRRLVGTDPDYNNPGTAITYVDSATDGASFTINEDGIYSVSYSDGANTSGTEMGVSVNSSQLSTNISAISDNHRVFGQISEDASGGYSNGAATRFFSAGDVIRPHTNNAPDRTSSGQVHFTLTQVQRFTDKVNLLTQDVVTQNSRIRLSFTGTTAAIGANVELPWDQVDENEGGGFSHSAGLVTCNFNGWVWTTARLSMNATTATNWQAQGLRNGSGGTGEFFGPKGYGQDATVLSGLVKVTKGDTLEINHNITTTYLGGNRTESYWDLVRVMDYGAFDPVGFGLATGTQAGLVEKTRYEVKEVTGGDMIGTGIEGTLQIANLKIGQLYSIELSGIANVPASGEFRLVLQDAGASIIRYMSWFKNTGSSVTNHKYSSGEFLFTPSIANEQTLDINLDTLVGATTLEGGTTAPDRLQMIVKEIKNLEAGTF